MKLGILLTILGLGVGTAVAQQASGVGRVPAPSDSTVHGLEFKRDCATCHTPENWRALRPVLDFDHIETGFTLRGAHADVGCRDCHISPVFHRIGVQCADCHTDVVHRGELGFDCDRCHNEIDWTQSANLLLEHQQTRFPLLGRHATTDCEACHYTVQRDEFVGVALECAQCHLVDYTSTVAPDHGAIGFSVDCRECHSVMDLRWSDVNFQHPSSFPLAFGHNLADCSVCHGEWQTSPDGQDCYACHDDDYASVAQPSHLDNGFPTDCRECHDVSGFHDPGFYGHTTSGFPISGGHSQVSCTTCHLDETYANLEPACFNCHSENYYATESPNHQVIGFPTTCEQCHTPDGWNIVSPKMQQRKDWQ